MNTNYHISTILLIAFIAFISSPQVCGAEQKEDGTLRIMDAIYVDLYQEGELSFKQNILFQRIKGCKNPELPRRATFMFRTPLFYSADFGKNIFDGISPVIKSSSGHVENIKYTKSDGTLSGDPKELNYRGFCYFDIIWPESADEYFSVEITYPKSAPYKDESIAVFMVDEHYEPHAKMFAYPGDEVNIKKFFPLNLVQRVLIIQSRSDLRYTINGSKPHFELTRPNSKSLISSENIKISKTFCNADTMYKISMAKSGEPADRSGKTDRSE